MARIVRPATVAALPHRHHEPRVTGLTEELLPPALLRAATDVEVAAALLVCERSRHTAPCEPHELCDVEWPHRDRLAVAGGRRETLPVRAECDGRLARARNGQKLFAAGRLPDRD